MIEKAETGGQKSIMPFVDLARTMAELYPDKMMEGFNKVLGEYNFPGVDPLSLLESTRKNVEALASANRHVLSNVETVMTRQGDILRETMDEASAAVKDLSTQESPAEAAAKQGELLRQIFDKALDNMREVAEMTTQANNEAFAIVNQRSTETLEEIRSMIEKLK